MNPWLILGAMLVWIASLASIGTWQNTAGHTDERAVWQAKAIIEAAQSSAQIIQLEQEARNTEQVHAARLADISTQYEQDKQNAKRKTDDLVAGLRAGAFGLRDPGATRVQTSGGNASAVATSPGECDGRAPGQLSAEAAEFLLRLTGEADEVTKQLASCQQVIISDREGM